jgi:hypothetical protein
MPLVRSVKNRQASPRLDLALAVAGLRFERRHVGFRGSSEPKTTAPTRAAYDRSGHRCRSGRFAPRLVELQPERLDDRCPESNIRSEGPPEFFGV